MFDLILAIVLALILVVALVVITYAQNKTEDKLRELAPTLQESFSEDVNVTQVMDDTFGKVGDSYSSFKWISVALIFGFFMSILVSAFVVKTHPAWFIGYIFIVVISVIISVYISNTYETLMMDPILAETFLTGFFAANYIFIYLPIWITIIGILAGILMYINVDIGGLHS